MDVTRNVLQPSSSNRVQNNDHGSVVKPNTSTPVKDGSSVDTDISLNISTVSGILPRTNAAIAKCEKENLRLVSGQDGNFVELKTVIFQRTHQFHQQKESLEQLNKQITELREKLEQEKKEVHATIDALKALSCVERRYHLEKERAVFSSDAKLQKYFEQLMTIVNHERNRLELKNISFLTEENFKKLLAQADSSIKSFNENKDFETVQKLASFLPTVEESLEQCHASNERCAEITESIERLLLHRRAVKAISDSYQAPT